jgi:hypothetical protein
VAVLQARFRDTPAIMNQFPGVTTILAVRMGDTAFLGRLWLAGPAGSSLRMIRDYGEIERLIATIDVERKPSKYPSPQNAGLKKTAVMSDPSRRTTMQQHYRSINHQRFDLYFYPIKSFVPNKSRGIPRTMSRILSTSPTDASAR